MGKLDLVVTSARYLESGERVALVRGYERRGAVWSDRQLFDRESLALRLRDGARVAVGRESELPGDFEIGQRLRLGEAGWIVTEGSRGGRDDLGVPLF
jgi:hypothetical protein